MTRTTTTHRPILRLLATATVAFALVAGSAQAAELPPKPTEAPRVQDKRVPAKSLPTQDSKRKRGVRATSSSTAPGYTRPSADCRYAQRTMTVGSLFKFNLARFPRGAYVYTQYAFARVDSAGRFISNATIGNFQNEGFVRPAIHTEYGAPGQGYITVYDWSKLAVRSTNVTWGHWVVWNQAAVWNDSTRRWELTGWSRATHESYDRFGSGGVASSCWVSLTA